MNNSILSTKLLSDPQQELVLHTGVSLTHFNILKIEYIHLKLDKVTDSIIITSQNAIPALLTIKDKIKNIYCVGDQTSAILKNNNIVPKVITQNAAQLASILTTTYTSEAFTYLCGEQRREELPALFLKEKIPLKELFVYRSIAVMKSFDRIFAVVTFYSPRSVHAFAKANPKNKPLIAVCIGNTTASTARNYFNKVIVANKQTIENTLITAIKALKND